MIEKQCTKCNIVKSINEFSKRIASNDNLQNKCKSCERTYVQQWRSNNLDHYKKYIQQWEKENQTYRNEYKHNKYMNDINYRLSQKLRTRLRKALLKQVTRKNDTTEALLGISYSEFRNYIEFLMNDDMEWIIIQTTFGPRQTTIFIRFKRY